MSAVLVTGGAGYIGSHAVKALVKAGRRVVIYDDLSAGHREAARHRRRRRARWSRATSAIPRASRRCSKSMQIESVMHFAAWLSVGDSVRDPAGYYHNNVIGALSVLEAMVAQSVKHLVFSSTAAVFGNPIETPITEEHPRRPINAYGETKLAIELALPHYERAYGLRSIALRYFNAAGADPDGELGEDHDPETHVLPGPSTPRTAAAAFQVFGDDYDTPDGTCLRDYVHVTDLASAHLLALDALRRGASSTALQPRQRPSDFGPRHSDVDRTGDRHARCPHARTAPRRRSADALRHQRPDPPRARLGAAVRGHRRHRRNRLAMAGAQSAGLREEVMP